MDGIKRRSSWNQMIVGLAFLALGIGVFMFGPVSRISCTRDQTGRVDCQAQKKLAGLVTLRVVPIEDTREVRVESDTVTQSGRPRNVDRLVFETPAGDVHPPWMTRGQSSRRGGRFTFDAPDYETVVERVDAFLEQKHENFMVIHHWGWFPVAVGGFFFAFGALALLPVLPRWRRRRTESSSTR